MTQSRTIRALSVLVQTLDAVRNSGDGREISGFQLGWNTSVRLEAYPTHDSNPLSFHAGDGKVS